MDLLFSRYASPFVLLDTLILTRSTTDFISNLYKTVNEERFEKTRWEFFLHKVYDKTWDEFLSQTTVSNEQKTVNLGATIKRSKNMLTKFSPESEV